MGMKRGVRLVVSIAGLFALSIIPQGSAQQSDDDEQSRQIFAAEFLNARPGPKPRRTPTAKATAAPVPLATDLLGITLWRLRPASTKDDTQARLLDHEGDSDAVLVAERVSSETMFKEGQKVRLSIESPRSGYLYVIDREQYADGTYSEPYLIFPTLKTRNGDNAVTAGRLIEVPDQDDRPFYFKMKRSRTDQVREVLTVIVTSQPISNLQLGRRPLKLANEQFAQWEQAWKAPAKRVELANHAGTTYTKAEKLAGASATGLLGHQDPPPQTIFRVSGKAGDPILITIPLHYATAP